jgi:hypothetical protein
MKPVRLVHLILLGAVVCVVLAMLAGVPEQIGRAYAWVSRAQGAEAVSIKGEPEAKRMYDRPKFPSQPEDEFPVEAKGSGRSPGALERVKGAAIAGERSPEDYQPPSKGVVRGPPSGWSGPSGKEFVKVAPEAPKEPGLSRWDAGPRPSLAKPIPGPPTLDELLREARQVEKEQREIMAGYDAARDATAPPEARASFREKLTNVLERQFDIQQQQRELEISQIEARIRRLREMLEKRNQARQKIVQERLNQLLREAEGLGWIAPGEAGPARSVSSPPFEEGVREQETVMPDGSRVRVLIPEYRTVPPPLLQPTPKPVEPAAPKSALDTIPPPPPAKEPLPAVPSIPKKGMPPEEEKLPLPSPRR